MADPFLAAHEIAPLCFDIGGRFQPVSIRDQMLRAFSLIEKLFAEKRLGAGSRILVVGAGAAGVTAGIQAAHNGGAVLIAEREVRPFTLQRLPYRRWIDPTLYDWPLTHWRELLFPWRASPIMPMPWTRGPASTIAQLWSSQLDAAQEKYGNLLELRYSTAFVRLEGIDTSGDTGSVRAVLEDRSGKKTELFNALIFATVLAKRLPLSPSLWEYHSGRRGKNNR